MTEYVLQKKTFGGWSYVTWYDNLDQAKRNFDIASANGNGYSWRMVKLDVIEERLLADPVPVPQPDSVEPLSDNGWRKVQEPVQSVKSAWGNQAAPGWGKPTVRAATASEPSNSSHGMVGKVWLGNPTTKEKKRVEPSMVDAMMKEGWVKAGPRTVL